MTPLLLNCRTGVGRHDLTTPFGWIRGFVVVCGVETDPGSVGFAFGMLWVRVSGCLIDHKMFQMGGIVGVVADTEHCKEPAITGTSL